MSFKLTQHHRGCFKLQIRPGAVADLQGLLENHTFWAKGRSRSALRRMLFNTNAAVAAWKEGKIVGFGRATSDTLFRAVIWDVIVAPEHQGNGVGQKLMKSLLRMPELAHVKQVYLMTTHSQGFYEQLGFMHVKGQKLMVKNSAT